MRLVRRLLLVPGIVLVTASCPKQSWGVPDNPSEYTLQFSRNYLRLVPVVSVPSWLPPAALTR
jgi:hypothetical protein